MHIDITRSALILKKYSLTTAEIIYHMPDHPALLQSYIWQEMDIAPEFPQLRKFLDFWQRELDGKLHSVQVAHQPLVSAKDFRYASTELYLH